MTSTVTKMACLIDANIKQESAFITRKHGASSMDPLSSPTHTLHDDAALSHRICACHDFSKCSAMGS